MLGTEGKHGDHLTPFKRQYFVVRQDSQVLRLLAGRNGLERVDRSLQGDAEEERPGREAEALCGAAGTACQARSFRSLQSAQR